MPPKSAELENILRLLLAEHHKLLSHLEAHHAAMKRLDLKAIDEVSRLQEASRVRIAALESRRKSAVAQLAGLLRLGADSTLTRIAQALPESSNTLLGLRERLRDLMTRVSAKAHVAGRVAGAVLGHLNTVVRLLSSAVEQAGVYTKQGVPQVSSRIGVLEAVA